LRAGTDAVTGKSHSPKTDNGLREFQFDVTAHTSIVLRFDDLAYNFFFGSFVGKKKQLAGGHGGRKTNDGAITENQHSLGALGERFALIAAFDGTRSIDSDRHFQCNGLLLNGRIAGRGGGRAAAAPLPALQLESRSL